MKTLKLSLGQNPAATLIVDGKPLRTPSDLTQLARQTIHLDADLRSGGGGDFTTIGSSRESAIPDSRTMKITGRPLARVTLAVPRGSGVKFEGALNPGETERLRQHNAAGSMTITADTGPEMSVFDAAQKRNLVVVGAHVVEDDVVLELKVKTGNEKHKKHELSPKERRQQPSLYDEVENRVLPEEGALLLSDEEAQQLFPNSTLWQQRGVHQVYHTPTMSTDSESGYVRNKDCYHGTITTSISRRSIQRLGVALGTEVQIEFGREGDEWAFIDHNGEYQHNVRATLVDDPLDAPLDKWYVFFNQAGVLTIGLNSIGNEKATAFLQVPRTTPLRVRRVEEGSQETRKEYATASARN